MPEKFPATRSRLELTERQREQIRQVTGRAVSAIELRLHELPELASSPPPWRRGRMRSADEILVEEH
jgi:hypothetical protein